MLTLVLTSCGLSKTSNGKSEEKMELTNKEKAEAVIRAFETGDSKVLDYISDEQYIQHNLNFPDGKDVLKGFFKGEPTGLDVKIHRVFEDGNFVALHTTYGGVWNNGTPQVAFDIFRFDDGLIVEHWDNLVDETPPNPSGRTQIDGATASKDLDKTKVNKELVSRFMKDAFIGGDFSNVTSFISTEKYLQHNPLAGDGLEGLNTFLKYLEDNQIDFSYTKLHRVIAEGDFVLTTAEGTYDGQNVAFYDLFRLENGLIVEHWDIINPIPPQSEWKNKNGKL
jgi:predicted SnoaL-like aldol condensation-catalyzing enzyme